MSDAWVANFAVNLFIKSMKDLQLVIQRSTAIFASKAFLMEWNSLFNNFFCLIHCSSTSWTTLVFILDGRAIIPSITRLGIGILEFFQMAFLTEHWSRIGIGKFQGWFKGIDFGGMRTVLIQTSFTLSACQAWFVKNKLTFSCNYFFHVKYFAMTSDTFFCEIILSCSPKMKDAMNENSNF